MLRVLAAATLLLAACSPAATPTPPATHAISGSITLTDSSGIRKDYINGTTVCSGSGGYDDINKGSQVIVKNQDGTIVATGTLQASVYKADRGCTFNFSVTGVPDDATFYSVAVGHRNALTYSKADMESRHWQLDLTLGG